MSSFLDLCEKFFATRDFYEVLKIERDVSEKEIKKAYHRVSLLVHPDRVKESEKAVATEKFKVLGKIHSVLTDKEKRSVYDECGEFDEESDSNCNWMEYWRSMFKKITTKDIENYEKSYVGSEMELRDIKKAYVAGKGSMDYMLEMVPFSDCNTEDRIIKVVRGMVDAGEVEEYDCFFNEPQKKKDKRRKAWEKESKEAAEIKFSDEDFYREMEENQERRSKQMFDMINQLEEKYCTKKGASTKRKSIKGKGEPSPKNSSAKKRKTRTSK